MAYYYVERTWQFGIVDTDGPYDRHAAIARAREISDREHRETTIYRMGDDGLRIDDGRCTATTQHYLSDSDSISAAEALDLRRDRDDLETYVAGIPDTDAGWHHILLHMLLGSPMTVRAYAYVPGWSHARLVDSEVRG